MLILVLNQSKHALFKNKTVATHFEKNRLHINNSSDFKL